MLYQHRTLLSPTAGDPRASDKRPWSPAPRLLTDGSGHGQGPVDSPAVHVRHEATQGLDALLLVLWGTAGVGAGAGRPARLRQRRCAGFRDRAGSRSPRKTPRGGIRRTVRNHEGAARPPRNAARPHQLGRRRSQSSHGRRPRCLPFHSGVLSPPCRSLCVATWQGWMKPEPGPVLSRSPPPASPVK